MVETITPVVHGGSRTRWALAVVLHTAAAAAVAASFGGLLGAAGALLGAPWGNGGGLVVAAGAAWAFAHEAFGVPFPVPQLRRQVPEWWRTFFSPFASAALYGAGLGIGFFTYLLHATLVVVALAALASGRPGFGAAVVGAFGLVRGLTVLAAVRGAEAVHALAAFARRRVLGVANAVALAAVGIAAVASVRGRIDVPGLAGAALAAAFAWGAAWKVVRFGAWRRIVEGYRLGVVAPIAAAAVPLVEGSIVVLFAANARRPAALTALAALGVFSAAAIRRRFADASRVPCGCLGAAETTLPALLARNGVLACAAGLALAASGAVNVPAPSASDALPIALSLAGAVGVTVAARSVRRSLRRGRA
jgi:hypothetical protein